MEEKRWKTSENNWKIDEHCWKNNEKTRNPTPNQKNNMQKKNANLILRPNQFPPSKLP
jgi:hypothetical protein